MILEFALMLCVATEPAHCAHVEGQRFATLDECRVAAHRLEDWWRAEIGADLPVPVHCEAEGA